MSRTTRADSLARSLAAALAALWLAWPALAQSQQLADASDVTDVEGESVGETHEVELGEIVAEQERAEEEAEADAAAWVEYRKSVGEYGKSVGNRYLVGLNSLITFPADPVMDTVKPRDEFDELPLAVGTKYVAGFFTGTMLSIYRASMGAFDVLCAPLTPMKMLSPEPRWMIFPGAQHDEF